MNDKMINNQEMNERDIENALKLLKEGIKRDIFQYEHANPLKENCYISSGYISGLWFPNSQIKVKGYHEANYDFCCIAKINYSLCVVFSLKDDCNPVFKKHLGEYLTETLEAIIYPYEERQIKANLEKTLKDYSDTLARLQKVERVYKKDHSDFKNLSQCFTNCNLIIERSYFDGTATAIKILYDVTLYRSDENRKNKTEPTAEEIETLLNEKITHYKMWIEDTKTALKCLRSNYLKMLKLSQTAKAFFNSLTHGESYQFKKQFERMF